MSYKADPKLIGSFDPDFYNEVTETFKSYDKNGDGVIQKNEFISLLKKLNLVFEPENVDILFKDLDSNNDSVISFIEFLELLLEVVQEDKEKK